jgi:hypothetical protein
MGRWDSDDPEDPRLIHTVRVMVRVRDTWGKRCGALYVWCALSS